MDGLFADPIREFRRFLRTPEWPAAMRAPSEMKLDVTENDKEYKAEIPGAKKEDVSVKIDGDTAEVKTVRWPPARWRRQRPPRRRGTLEMAATHAGGRSRPRGGCCNALSIPPRRLRSINALREHCGMLCIKASNAGTLEPTMSRSLSELRPRGHWELPQLLHRHLVAIVMLLSVLAAIVASEVWPR